MTQKDAARQTSQTTSIAQRRSSSGDAHGPVYEGQARLAAGAELDQIRAAVRAKYGLMAAALGLAESLARLTGAKHFGSERAGVVIAVDGR